MDRREHPPEGLLLAVMKTASWEEQVRPETRAKQQGGQDGKALGEVREEPGLQPFPTGSAFPRWLSPSQTQTQSWKVADCLVN